MALPLLTGELRRHARVAFERRAWCEHRDWTLYLCVVNLSCTGLFIQTSTPFARGDQLQVCLTASPASKSLASERVQLEVEVRWSSSRGRVQGVGCSIRSFSRGQAHYLEMVEQLAQLVR